MRLALTPFLLAVASGCTPAVDELVPVEDAPRYAVVFSDFSSSSIGLLDGDLGMMAPDWVTSGTRSPILVLPVTADAVLPTEPLGMGLLAWIDRFPADVLTLVDPTTPRSLVQLDVHGAGPATGYASNPHDAVRLPDGRLLVSRHNPDLTLLGTPEARGNDLVAIDPATERQERVDLRCDAGDVYARPDQLAMLRVGDRDLVLVALVRLGAEFATFAEGALATVDARTLMVLDCEPLPRTVNCQYVRAVPDRGGEAIALCTGNAFEPETVRRELASVLAIRVDGEGAITVGERLDGTDVETFSVPTAFPLPLGEGRLLAIADGRGEEGRRPDRLLRIDLGAGTTEVLAETASFSLGHGTYSHDGRFVLVPDGATNELIRYSIEEARIVDRIPLATATGLPIRQITRL